LSTDIEQIFSTLTLVQFRDDVLGNEKIANLVFIFKCMRPSVNNYIILYIQIINLSIQIYH